MLARAPSSSSSSSSGPRSSSTRSSPPRGSPPRGSPPSGSPPRGSPPNSPTPPSPRPRKKKKVPEPPPSETTIALRKLMARCTLFGRWLGFGDELNFQWIALYVIGSCTGLACVCLVMFIVYVFVKSLCCRRKNSHKEKKVPHEHPVEFYYSSISLDQQALHACLVEKKSQPKVRDLDCGWFGRFEHVDTGYLSVNPSGSLPTLVHKGHPVYNLHELLTYMEANFQGGVPLVYKDAVQNEIAQKWLDMCTDRLGTEKSKWSIDNGGMTLGHAVAVLSSPASLGMDRFTFLDVCRSMLRHPRPTEEFPKLWRCLWRPFVRIKLPPAHAVQAAFRFIDQIFDHLEKTLQDGRKYVVGPSVCAADIFLAASFNRLELLGVLEMLLVEYGKVAKYWARLQERESFSAVFRPNAEEGDGGAAKAFVGCLEAFKQKLAEVGPTAAYHLDEVDEVEEE